MIEPTISTFSVTKGGKVGETYACFAAWDLNTSLDQNLVRLREENLILAPTDAWLKEMCRIIRARFGDIERHRSLIRLAQRGLAEETWKPILLWHLCFRELLLSDFLEMWLFVRKEEGLLRVRADDVGPYLTGVKTRGLAKNDWKPSSISKMTSALPKYAADFGLLQGKAVKQIVPYHLPDEALLYVLHDIKSERVGAEKVLTDIRWRRFLFSRAELEQELLRLHQKHQLSFEIAGSLVSLELPHKHVDDYVERLVG